MQNNMILQTTATVGKELMQHPILATFTAAGMLIFQYGFGSSKVVLATFILFVALIALDWLSGTSAAKKDGIDTSRYGIDGVGRTVFLLTLPGVARIIDVIVGTEVVLMGFVVGVLARSIAKSIIANIKRAEWDVDIPDNLINWVSDELKQKDARALQRIQDRDKFKNDGGNE